MNDVFNVPAKTENKIWPHSVVFRLPNIGKKAECDGEREIDQYGQFEVGCSGGINARPNWKSSFVVSS